MGSNTNISIIFRIQQFWVKLRAKFSPISSRNSHTDSLTRRMIKAVDTILDSLPDDEKRSVAVTAWGLGSGRTQHRLPGFGMGNRCKNKGEVLLHLQPWKQDAMFDRDIPEFFDKELEDEFIRYLDNHAGEPDECLNTESQAGLVELDRLRIEMNASLTTRGYVELLADLFPNNLLLHTLAQSGWTQTLIKTALDKMASNAVSLLRELAKYPAGCENKTLEDKFGETAQVIGGWKANVSSCTNLEGMLHLPHPIGGNNALHPAWIRFLRSLE